MNDYIKHIVLEKSQGRQVVYWGGMSTRKSIQNRIEYFENEGINTGFFVDSNYEKTDGKMCFHHRILKNNADKYYVVVLSNYYREIYDNLEEYGFCEIEDYIYINHQPVIINQVNNYQDYYGNKIIGNLTNCKIQIEGWNSTIVVGRKFHFDGVLNVRNCVNVEIGDNVFMDQGAEVFLLDYSKMKIGKKCTFGKNFRIAVRSYTTCIFGEDCMIANNVDARTNDGHSIIDLETGVNISSSRSVAENRKIIIGNHVWVGQEALLMYNTDIGDGSIVGARALVKGKFDKNIICAGMPAKVIRENVSWIREPDVEAISVISND